MKLEIHDDSPTDGGLRKPVFTATTEEATRKAGNMYTAQGIEARAEREGDLPVTFTAAEGTIDLDNKLAELRGKVELRAGDIVMNLADVTWDAKAGTARSEHALTLADGSSILTASGMELNTKDRTYSLRDPGGDIRLKHREGSI
jgi:hypothetical protein